MFADLVESTPRAMRYGAVTEEHHVAAAHGFELLGGAAQVEFKK